MKEVLEKIKDCVELILFLLVSSGHSYVSFLINEQQKSAERSKGRNKKTKERKENSEVLLFTITRQRWS